MGAATFTTVDTGGSPSDLEDGAVTVTEEKMLQQKIDSVSNGVGYDEVIVQATTVAEAVATEAANRNTDSKMSMTVREMKE